MNISLLPNIRLNILLLCKPGASYKKIHDLNHRGTLAILNTEMSYIT